MCDHFSLVHGHSQSLMRFPRPNQSRRMGWPAKMQRKRGKAYVADARTLGPVKFSALSRPISAHKATGTYISGSQCQKAQAQHWFHCSLLRWAHSTWTLQNDCACRKLQLFILIYRKWWNHRSRQILSSRIPTISANQNFLLLRNLLSIACLFFFFLAHWQAPSTFKLDFADRITTSSIKFISEIKIDKFVNKHLSA